MICLGLDVSTRIVGYSILSEDKVLIRAGFIDLSKIEDLSDKTTYLKDKLLEIKEEYKIDNIGIEDCLTKFAGGRSSIKTIGKLIAFNYLTRYICYTVFDIKPVVLNVIRARTLADCKVPRGENSKEYIVSRVMELYENIDWPRMKKDKTRFSKECEDIADSVVISRALVKEITSIE